MNNISKELAFLILAAGKGTRMKNDLPKVMHPVAGVPMIEHVLNVSMKFSPKKLIPVLSDDMPEVAALVKKKNANADIVIQKERLGTGHAVKLCLEKLGQFDGTVVVMYGDTPFISADTVEKMAALVQQGAAVCVLGFETSAPNQYGRLVVTGNELKEIVEFKEASEAQKKITLCNSGVMAFNGKLIAEIVNTIGNSNSKGEYYLTDAVGIAAKSGYACKTVTTEENEVMGVNSQQERAMAENILQAKLRKHHLDNGVIMTAPDTVFFSTETEIAPGAVIEPFVVFKGKVKIGSGCEVRSFSHLEDCELGSNVIVGPYARLRPGSILEDESRIGNFVEIKKSRIGKGSKVNHLSYIGDAELGSNVNIGAGTITCNYDGTSKYNTKIEDGAFIGSNSALVAPVTVGKGAIVGAGTTLLKDAEAGKITVNETRNRVMEKK